MNTETVPILGQAVLVFEVVVNATRWVLFWLIPWAALATVVYLLISMPQRRRERARFFLDLLGIGLRAGRSPEESIVSAARARDRAPGVRFHMLAAHIEKGMRLGAALELVPRLLPPALRGMIQAGEKSGRLQEVVGLCRGLVRDNPWHLRHSIGYAAVLLLVLVPVQIFLLLVQRIWILPRLSEILADFGSSPPPFSSFILERYSTGLMVLLVLFAILLAGSLVVVGGPRVAQWFGPVSDRIAWLLPWVRGRLRAQFATLFSLLLDAGMPEREAVDLAARSTCNSLWIRRASAVSARLAEGITLTEALGPLDLKGELRWRVANAAAGGGGGFWGALRGWQEALTLRAQQQEQAAAQLATATLIVVNGVFVGLLGAAVFLLIIHLIRSAVLW